MRLVKRNKSMVSMTLTAVLPLTPALFIHFGETEMCGSNSGWYYRPFSAHWR